ncbi:MAG: regulatory protein RecX [Bacilli bacterium]
MKIEKYELTKKNIYNVYLSNGEVLELNGKVITDNELLIKKDIDNELYDKLKRDNTICILVNTSVKYIDRRLRSINELRDYLKNKEEDTIIIEEVIDKLIDYKYLDDDRFTKAFIKDKLNFTNWGDYKIKNELKRLGVNEEIIYNNMTSIDDNIFYERINKIIDKDISINKKYSGIKLKNKIYNHLLTLGYSKEKVISIINNYNF